jgi:Leu/Phe-tRNA-protein transferase
MLSHTLFQTRRNSTSLAKSIAGLMVIFNLLAAPSAFAAAPDACLDVFSGKTTQLQSISEANQVEELFKQAATGISHRGFLGNVPVANPLTESLAREKGMMRWGLRIYVQPSLEAAQLHAAAEPDVLMQGVYLIGEPTHKFESKAKATVLFNDLSAHGLYYFGNGHAEKIEPTLVSSRLIPDQLRWSISEPDRGPYIYQHGWFFPKVRGTIRFADTTASVTYKNVRKLARKLASSGFKITFNHDFVKSLDMVKEQERKGQEGGNSRFKDPEVYQEALSAFNNGQAFSVEVWDDKGSLVGGLISFRTGNLYSPDSVFYDNVNYKNAIDFSKVAMVALMDRLQGAGIPFVDAGMVTPFTASMKGRLVSGDDFIKMVKSLPETPAVVDFSNWIPEGIGSIIN